MDYKDLKKQIGDYSGRSLAQRSHWYSPAAEAYNKARPKYPDSLIQQVVNIAQLSSSSRILEVGCGPATATVAFAPLGCSMLCVEPNPDFYQLARQNCSQYETVEFQNISFEEWKVAPNRYDAVLAASSFHWIPSDVGYPKAAQALRENGRLILLWNKELQPSYEVYLSLSEVYEAHAPSLMRFEDEETQAKILQGLGQMIIESGHFKELIAGSLKVKALYSVDDYLTLLNTYSPYLKLTLQTKKTLFDELQAKIESDFDGNLELSYISAFHVARKCQEGGSG